MPSPQCQSLADIEEERRLFFVAITRARKYLFFTLVNDAKNRLNVNFLKELKIKKEDLAV
jgi:superfamily I DNA/RNA helicase